MARKMKKFSAGGAQGRYERRMADIEKDYAKAAARKTGRAAEVAAAKRDQRKADAEDDRAKRMGLDRTKTREAERNAEYNLTRTRRSGAAMPAVTKDELIAPGKITESLSLPKMDSSIGAKPSAAKKPAASKPKPKPSAADTARSKFFQDSLRKTNFKTAARMAEAPIAPSKFDKAAFEALKTKAAPAKTVTTTGGTALRGKPGGTPLVRFGKDVTNDPARAVKLATLKKAAEAPGASGYAKSRYETAVSSGMYAKGGTVKKETTMNKKPVPANKKPMPKEPITGGSSTVPLTPERKEFLKELAKRNAKPGMAKGGKATKFGKALVKKSADTMGRAMVKKACGGSMKKYASGGSVSSASKRADGCAVKGKTKGTMLARGGAAKMRGRDSYGGAEFKKGGSC